MIFSTLQKSDNLFLRFHHCRYNFITTLIISFSLSQILRDAMGYMGLYCIFMLLKEGGKEMDDFDDIGCIESISLKNMPELLWGDRIGR